MQSTIIITNGNISIVSHNNPIPANRSKTLGIVATAPELTRRQRLVLFIARVVTVTLTWSFFRAMLDGRSFWLRVLGDVALLYQWALYWRVFDRMKQKQEFLLNLLVDNDVVGDDNFIKWYLENTCSEAATPLTECYGALAVLILIAYRGALLEQRLILGLFAASALISIALAYFGRMWLIKRFQKLY